MAGLFCAPLGNRYSCPMHFMKSQSVKTPSSALVVDDDPFSVAIAQRVLRKLGFDECAVAHDGVEGLHVLSQMERAPDLILCDIFMPNKDGIEFLEALAKQRYQGQVVVVSGGQRLMLDIAERLSINGGLNVAAKMTKPLDFQQLSLALGIAPSA
jgi:CheY-like chemotaxis protein